MSTDYGLSAFAVDGEGSLTSFASPEQGLKPQNRDKRIRRLFMARSAVVPIRVSPEERLLLFEAAKRFSVSLSEFVRRAALKLRMPPPAVGEVNRETYRELCRIGNNVNQLTRAVNEGRVAQVDAHLLGELRALIKEVGLQCLGLGVVSVADDPR
jgi:mobilization protein NikA